MKSLVFVRFILLYFIIVLCCASCSSNTGFSIENSNQNSALKNCKPNAFNSEPCFVDSAVSYSYTTQNGGRNILGKSILGSDGLAKVSIPDGWYDGSTKITFTESNLNPSSQNKIRSGYDFLGIVGTMATSLPNVCAEGASADCLVPAAANQTFYAHSAQYGGRTNLCLLNQSTKLMTDCWVDNEGTRTNTVTPLLDQDCSTSGAISAACTIRANKYWYDQIDGGRTSCLLGSTILSGCWLNISSSVVLSNSSSSVTTTKCLDARSVGFSSSTSCIIDLNLSPNWYVYNSSYGGRSSECIADNNGNCFFSTGFSNVDSDLKSENIKLGVKIFNINGSFEGDGVWGSAAHRTMGVSQISFTNEAISYKDRTILPYGYRSVPLISVDDEGTSLVNTQNVNRQNWNSACGLTGNVTSRISDCYQKFDVNSVWYGGVSGNSGQGNWKLVTRVSNVSDTGIYREVWRDEKTGLLWSSVVSKILNWCQSSGVFGTDPLNICNSVTYQIQAAGATKAISACYEGTQQTSSSLSIDVLAKAKTNTNPLTVNWRIPTLNDYEVAEYNGIRFVLPDMLSNGGSEWTATTRSADLSKAWVFNSKTGKSELRSRTDALRVRCVGDKGL